MTDSNVRFEDTRWDLVDDEGTFLGLSLAPQQARERQRELAGEGRRVLLAPAHYREPVAALRRTLECEQFDLVDQSARVPRFLGLTLALADAWERRRQEGRRLLIWPARYGGLARVTEEEAQAIAHRDLAARQRQIPDLTWGPIRLTRLVPWGYVYSSASPELVEQGYIPGAMFCTVDKLDGHVWKDEDLDVYWHATGQAP